jgi:hypothetical protein
MVPKEYEKIKKFGDGRKSVVGSNAERRPQSL